MIKKILKVIKLTIWQKRIIIFLVIIPIIICSIVNYVTIPDLSDNNVSKVPVEIPKGATLQAIAETLKTKKLIDDVELFKIWMISMGKETDIKAGYFDIPEGLNYAQLAMYLTEARVKQLKVTLLEGWNIEEIAVELESCISIDKNKFIDLIHDTTFIKQLGLKQSSLEGYLLPDTYYFYWGMNEEAIITNLVQNCMAIFDSSVQKQLDSLDLSIHQILTLASIIEGEAIYDDERPIISSVYHNRLNRKIKLQADPTIQYIVEGPPRRLLFKDLEIDSPYNTYKYYGLPPGPINNPGKKSILAAIYPEKTKYIYFVATGDGRHSFSETASGHAKAKQEFDKVRREVFRKKKQQKMRNQ